MKFIESKNGPNATLNTNQKAAFAEMQDSGAMPVGDNARKAGLPVGEWMSPDQFEIQVDNW